MACQLSKFKQQESSGDVKSFLDQNVSLQSVVANLESDQEAFKHTISDMDIKLQKSKNEIIDLLAEKNCVVKAKESIEGQFNMKTQDFNKLHAETLKNEK